MFYLIARAFLVRTGYAYALLTIPKFQWLDIEKIIFALREST